MIQVNMKLTKEEFERRYAERSGVTLQFLHEHGEAAVPCDCDYEGCQGWRMQSTPTPEQIIATVRAKAELAKQGV